MRDEGLSKRHCQKIPKIEVSLRIGQKDFFEILRVFPSDVKLVTSDRNFI
ncbi:hypothetical protein J3R74_002172 [Puniceicoccus vermicola]